MSFNKALVIAVALFLQACGQTVAPVHQRDVVREPEPVTTDRGATVRQRAQQTNQNAGYHVVKKGDTLYSIAWRYSKDYKSLASWNRISSPYTIYPGQIVRLKPTSKQPTAAAPIRKKGTSLQTQTLKKSPAKKPAASTATQKKTIAKPSPVATKPASSVPLPAGPVKWSWPTLGKIVKSNSPTSKKGIDISGKSGQTIKAAATGDVVYSGSGLFGYGKLIIIKHNETYLSAYAYNSKLLVKEGDRVRAGQPISYMGQDHSGRTVLHFEIRKNGKPTNPITYLPRKPA